MSNSPILGIAQVSPNQVAKEVTINDAISALEASSNASLAIDMSGGDASIDLVDFTRHVAFVLAGATEPVQLALPDQSARLFLVANTSDFAATLVRGEDEEAITLEIPAGSTQIVLLTTDAFHVVAGGGAEEEPTVDRSKSLVVLAFKGKPAFGGAVLGLFSSPVETFLPAGTKVSVKLNLAAGSSAPFRLQHNGVPLADIAIAGAATYGEATISSDVTVAAGATLAFVAGNTVDSLATDPNMSFVIEI